MIHSTGVIILRSVQGFMYALGYLDILQTRVLPWLDQTGEKDQLIVVQDNARYHTTPDIFQFCNQNGINVLQWPPCSPDLNVIENFWALLKRYIRKRRPRNIEQLMDFMNHFRLLPSTRALCANLYRSFPDRCDEVMDNLGYRTKY